MFVKYVRVCPRCGGPGQEPVIVFLIHAFAAASVTNFRFGSEVGLRAAAELPGGLPGEPGERA